MRTLHGWLASVRRPSAALPEHLLVSAVIAFSAAILLPLLLASRPLYVASDDAAYINYFEGRSLFVLEQAGDWFGLILEEPVWALLAPWLGSSLGPEQALRTTIFVSASAFLIATTRLARGAWVFVLLVFVFDRTLSTLMYFGQLRQGFALSCFLVLAAARLPLALAAAFAALIHSSFLFVLPFALAAPWLRDDRLNRLMLVGVALGMIALYSVVGPIDLGRRADDYASQGGIKDLTFVFMIVQYGLALFLCKPSTSDVTALVWYRFTLAVVLGVVLLSFFYSGAARLFYYASVFTAISVGMVLHTTRGFVAGAIWIVFLVFIDLYLSVKADFHPETWYGIWATFLS